MPMLLLLSPFYWFQYHLLFFFPFPFVFNFKGDDDEWRRWLHLDGSHGQFGDIFIPHLPACCSLPTLSSSAFHNLQANAYRRHGN